MAIQSNIISDLATITRLPVNTISELIKRECLCIGSAIHDAIIHNEDAAILNIGIGTLSVDISTKQCKFVPSRQLKNIINKSIDNKIDPIEFALEQSIINKLLEVCNGVI